MTNDRIIFYDGYCKLCNFSKEFIVKRDKKGAFQYYPLQSAEAKGLISKRFAEVKIPDSVILIEKGRMYLKSAAFFKILPHLGRGYKLLVIFKIFPRRFTDKIYDLIAANRYKWFGKNDKCEILDL